MTLGEFLDVIPKTQDGYRVLYAALTCWHDVLHHPIDTSTVLTTAVFQQLLRCMADHVDL